MLEQWAETISLEDLALVEQPYRAMIQDVICGNPQKGLPPLGRIFYIEPAKKDSVFVQTGFRRSRRTYREIKGPTALPADLAIAAFCQWGPMAKVSHQRSFLKEHDPTAPAPKKKTRKRATKTKIETAVDVVQE